MKLIIIVSILLVVSIIPMLPYIGPITAGFAVMGLGVTVGLWLATLNVLTNGRVRCELVTVVGRQGKGLVVVVA